MPHELEPAISTNPRPKWNLITLCGRIIWKERGKRWGGVKHN